MKNIFNNSLGRFVREEVNELRGKPSDSPSAATSNRTYPSLTNEQQDRTSLLGKIESTATNLLGNVVGADHVASAAHKLNSAVTRGKTARELLCHGAIVQLQSKNSARLIQVVMSANGTLVYDGDGSYTAFNTYFTVEEGEKGRFRFHNNCNYLAVEGKTPCILTLPPGPKNNRQVEFRVHDVLGSTEYISFESCATKNYFLAVDTNGHLRLSQIKEKRPEFLFSIIAVPLASPPPTAMPVYAAPSAPNFPYTTHVPAPAAPSAPPPPYTTIDPFAQSSTLYPKLN